MTFSRKLRRDGNALHIEGVAEIPRLFFVEHFGFQNFLNDDILRWIDQLAESGANGMRVFGFWPFAKGREAEPFLKTWDGYNLNCFNPDYFDHLHTWVSYAQAKGVVVLFELFDAWGIANARFAPYHPFYQVVKNNLRAFSDLRNQALMNLQKRYIQKVVETLHPNSNVIFGIMNEFKGEPHWHYEMSQFVKRLAPEYLTSASRHDSEAMGDPHVDVWFVHSGRYDFTTGDAAIWADMRDLRLRTGDQAILGFSTAGFGKRGKHFENPVDMRRLAQEVAEAGVTLFGFVDHKAYTAWGGGNLAQLNSKTYQAIAEAFQPTALSGTILSRGAQPVQKAQAEPPQMRDSHPARILSASAVKDLPQGYLDRFDVAQLPATHPAVFVERGGKAIRATTQQGFLCCGQYRAGYPATPLLAIFHILIDNNTADDQYVLILDVYDHHGDRLLAKQGITRKDFPITNEFCPFVLDFTPSGSDAILEFRVYYMGYASVIVNSIAVLNPAQAAIQSKRDLIPPTVRPAPPLPRLEGRIIAPPSPLQGIAIRQHTPRPLREKNPALEKRRW